jgi:hypothetical protein
MRMGRLAAIAVLVAAAPVLLAAPSEAAKIGVASAVKNRVESVGARTRPLSPGSDVFQNERLRTGEGSSAQLLFLDETSLSIGPLSEVTLDRFVFDPRRGAGSVVINTTRGAFRFVSGSQQPSSYQIRTPVATIGLRGTIFDWALVNIGGQPALVVILVQGSLVGTVGGVTYTLDKPGQALIIRGPNQVEQVTWDGTLWTVVSDMPFPLFGYSFIGDPRRIEVPDRPFELLDLLDAKGSPPAINAPPPEEIEIN